MQNAMQWQKAAECFAVEKRSKERRPRVQFVTRRNFANNFMLGFPAFLSHDIIVTDQVLVLVQFTNVHTAVENAMCKWHQHWAEFCCQGSEEEKPVKPVQQVAWRFGNLTNCKKRKILLILYSSQKLWLTWRWVYLRKSLLQKKMWWHFSDARM